MYTGTIYWAQIDAIKNLIKAVEGIEKFKVVLHLYTPHDENYLKRKGIFQTDKVSFKKGLPSEMRKIQKEASVLFVPLSFKSSFPFLINSSSPGKTYEYMASGRPILIHAPRDSYISRYAMENEFALVVNEDSAQKLKEGIIKLITENKIVNKITENAWKTLLLNHNAEEQSKYFQSFFMKNEF